MTTLSNVTKVDFGTAELRQDGATINYWDGSSERELADERAFTLAGVATHSTDLGTFTGTTIADNDDIKGALQALETAVEVADTTQEHAEYVSFTSASAATLAISTTVPAGAWITDVRLLVSTAWDGTAPSITVGNATDGTSFVSNSSVFDLKSVGDQIDFVMEQPTAAEDLNLYITQDSSTTGSAVILVKWVA